MKAASIVFSIISIVSDCIAIYVIYPIDKSYSLYFAISIIAGVLTLISLGRDRKHIFLGIIDIVFLGVFAGVFYLCWKPYNYYYQRSKF